MKIMIQNTQNKLLQNCLKKSPHPIDYKQGAQCALKFRKYDKAMQKYIHFFK